jgi:hypothetical protein
MGSLLVCDWPHFDWTKSLVCKDAFHMDSTIQKCFRCVSILALFCVWTKSLMCNDAVNRDSTFRVMSEDYAFESEEFQVPC